MAGASESGLASAATTHGKLEEPDHSSSNWYFSREYIESDSPSRKDGIDLKRETYLRKSYCTFLQDLGMRLKVPQVTIATAIVFCHRFFLRHSHLQNDRHMIATICMFLAGKVEETPKGLRDVIFFSYQIRNKKDPEAVQRIKQKEVYEPQKELMLLGERLVLTTLGFDLNVHHPYKPLVAAIKKFKVAQHALAQVAWNFVNDGLRTSLCLQFKPHHIAAGAIFLAAKFLKVKLPSEGEKVWWQEFEVTPRQLEEVSNQMLELYEQNREVPASRSSDPSASIGANNLNIAAVQTPCGTIHAAENCVTGETKARTIVEGKEPKKYSPRQAQPKTSWAGLHEVNSDSVKADLEKQLKSRGETRETRCSIAKPEITEQDTGLHEVNSNSKTRKFKGESRETICLVKPELTEEEELVERDFKSGHLQNRDLRHHQSHVEGNNEIRSVSKPEPSNEDLLEREGPNGHKDGSFDGKYWHAHNEDHHQHYHHHQHQRRFGPDTDHYHYKDRDWQEREHKRTRFEHSK